MYRNEGKSYHRSASVLASLRWRIPMIDGTRWDIFIARLKLFYLLRPANRSGASGNASVTATRMFISDHGVMLVTRLKNRQAAVNCTTYEIEYAIAAPYISKRGIRSKQKSKLVSAPIDAMPTGNNGFPRD